VNCQLSAALVADLRDATPGPYVCLCVTDSGVGMPPAVRARAFDPFFTTKPLGQGTGLGLSMVYGFARQSEGHVHIASEIGQGTTVKLYLPRYRGIVDDAGAAASLTDPRRAADGETVLVIEDETSVRAALRRLLKEKGIEATIVATTADALTLIGEQGLRPGLLLCDYNLRGSPDGVTTINQLRAALGHDVPAVVMTGDTRSQTVSSISPRGVSLRIKPFRAEELLQAIRNHAPQAVAPG